VEEGHSRPKSVIFRKYLPILQEKLYFRILKGEGETRKKMRHLLGVTVPRAKMMKDAKEVSR
jgi:hypothetical protein